MTLQPQKIVLLVLAVAAIVLFFVFDLGRFLTLASLQANHQALVEFHDAHRLLTVAAFMAIYIVQTALSLPGAAILSLAAGALFVTPDVEGNRAYCRWEENCLRVELNSVPSYREALEHLAALGEADVEAMRSAGYAVLGHHTLDEERRLFGEFLEELAG